MNAVAREWLAARNVIAGFLRDLLPHADKSAIEHNAAAILARLAQHQPPILTSFAADQMANTQVVYAGPVAIACMKPEAREALDRAVAAWEQSHGGQDAVETQQSVYRTLYWLYRWSGLIQAPAGAVG